MPRLKKQNRPENPHQDEVKEGNMVTKFQDSFIDGLFFLLRLILWPIKYLLTILLPHTIAGSVLGILLLFIIYGITCAMKSYFFNLIRLQDSIGILASLINSCSTPIVYFYCSTLHGPFCTPKNEKSKSDQIAQIARTVTGTAQKASNIFESVFELSDPGKLGIYQSEILELSFAIRWSSDLPKKDLLSIGLAELAELSREVKDKLVDLNSQGLNTFSLIVYEFSRLGDLMHWVQTGKKKYTSQTIERNLDILFSHLSTELSRILDMIENLIPLASRATNLGMQVSENLHREHYQLIHKKSHQGLWKKLLDLTSFSGQQLHRDLALTSESIKNLRATWNKLEQIRTDLLTYRNNVSNFKASFTGWHLADHQLTPEDEIFSMREVIESFQNTIKLVKEKSHFPYSSSYPSFVISDTIIEAKS